MTTASSIEAFWHECRSTIPGLSEHPPEAWSFGATAAQADELLALVLAGVKTATASSVWDYEHAGVPFPEPGSLNIILDGRRVPRALLETTSVEVVSFDEVSQAHAYAEGEDDRTLSSWRKIHEHFWREHSENPRGFTWDMPVLCEQFRLLFDSEPFTGHLRLR